MGNTYRRRAAVSFFVPTTTNVRLHRLGNPRERDQAGNALHERRRVRFRDVREMFPDHAFHDFKRHPRNLQVGVRRGGREHGKHGAPAAIGTRKVSVPSRPGVLYEQTVRL